MNKKVIFALLAGCAVLCICSLLAGGGIWYYLYQQKPVININEDDITFDDSDEDDEIIYDDEDEDIIIDEDIIGSYFTDSFDDNSNEWEVGTFEGEYIDSTEEISDGKLYFNAIAVAEDGGFTYDSLYANPYYNFEASVEAKQIEGSEEADYGLIFRKNTNDELYMFFINETYGEFILSTYADGQFTDVMDDWVSSTAISATTTNVLKVRMEGTQIDLYINDVLVYTISDNTLTEAGDIGVVVNLYEVGQEATIAFDNLTITPQ